MSNPDAPKRRAPPGRASAAAPGGAGKSTRSEADLGEDTALPGSSVVKEGATLGGYRLIRKLGAGGMGLVFEAEDVVLKRRVALKVMRPEVAAKEAQRDRFLREAQAAAQIEHDHVVPIFQVGEDKGIPFIAMPFLKGEPLDVRLKRGPLEIHEMISIGRQTAEGLAAAHDRGLIHRDIKPANIWLEETGGSRQAESGLPARKAIRVKILDFGLARSADEQANLTKAGTVMGTPAYMAPEQARGRPLDHRADLFSLGVVLFEICAGKRPFDGPDTMSVLSSLALDDPGDPRALNPELPELLGETILKLLEKDAANRPGSAREVAKVLASLSMDNTVVVVAKTSADAGPSPFADLHESSTDIVAPIAPSSPAAKEPKAKGKPAPKTEKEAKAKGKPAASNNMMPLMIGGGAVLALLMVVGAYFATRSLSPKTEPSQASANSDDGSTTRPPPKPKAKKASDPKGDYALRFNGVAQVEIPSVDLDTIGPFTLEAVVVPDDLLPSQIKATSYVFWMAARLNMRQRVMGNGWVFYYPNQGPKGALIQSNGRTAGVRSHIAAVYTGTKFQLYVDGKLEASEDYNQPLQKAKPPKDKTRNIGNGFYGVIDEVRISRVARYDKDFTPETRFEPDKDTLALYHFNEGHGTVAKDSSGHGHDGTIDRATWVNADGSPVP